MPVNINTALKEYRSNTPMIRDITHETSTFSSLVIFPSNKELNTFKVNPGQMAVLTGYGLDTGSIDFYKVLINSSSAKIGGTCCDPEKKDIPTRISLRAKVCSWVLQQCEPILVIKVPGIYELMPTDVDSEVTVTLDMYPIQDV